MRVIGGTAGGLHLKCLEGSNTRPTADRAKESLFNILSPYLDGSSVLDLFAGTGALGIEALSRGAKDCVFVDSSGDAAKIIKQNLDHTRLTEKAKLTVADADAVLKSISQKFDLIFLDPPYSQGLLPHILELISDSGLLKHGGRVIAESDIKNKPPEKVGGLVKTREKKYGITIISFYQEG